MFHTCISRFFLLACFDSCVVDGLLLLGGFFVRFFFFFSQIREIIQSSHHSSKTVFQPACLIIHGYKHQFFSGFYFSWCLTEKLKCYWTWFTKGSRQACQYLSALMDCLIPKLTMKFSNLRKENKYWLNQLTITRKIADAVAAAL